MLLLSHVLLHLQPLKRLIKRLSHPSLVRDLTNVDINSVLGLCDGLGLETLVILEKNDQWKLCLSDLLCDLVTRTSDREHFNQDGFFAQVL